MLEVWLNGKNPGKGAKLAGRDFWEFMSGPVHANARAVLDWLAVTQSDDSAKVVIGPERRPDMTNAALAYMAGEARDIANLLAMHSDVRLDLMDLDAKIRAAHDLHIPETASSARTGDDAN